MSLIGDPKRTVEIFDTISRGRFLDNLIAWRYEPDSLNIPFWLQTNSLNTLSEWIVAFFEARIVKG